MRDERPEQEHYRHATLWEQTQGELLNLWHQPKVLLLLAVIAGGWLVLQLTTPAVVQVEGLRTGDCIYVPTRSGSEIDASRPTGTTTEIVSGLYRAGAERAPCDGSHGHEVAAAFVFDEPSDAPFPGAAALAERQGTACEAAFEAFVGRPSDGSALALTLVVPDQARWEEGRRAGACLVGNADGTYLSARAAGSGR